MSTDPVEWIVAYLDKQDALHIASDGAQSVFSRSSGDKFAKRLGAPWSLYHHFTKLPPEEHQQLMDSKTKAGPIWGSGWSQ